MDTDGADFELGGEGGRMEEAVRATMVMATDAKASFTRS